MATIFERGKETAQRLLGSAAFGTTFTLTRRVPGTYDPATGSQPSTETTYTVTGVPTSNRVKAGTDLDRTRHMTLIIAPNGFTTPMPDDELALSGVTWKVGSCEAITHQGVTVAYTVDLSR